MPPLPQRHFAAPLLDRREERGLAIVGKPAVNREQRWKVCSQIGEVRVARQSAIINQSRRYFRPIRRGWGTMGSFREECWCALQSRHVTVDAGC